MCKKELGFFLKAPDALGIHSPINRQRQLLNWSQTTPEKQEVTAF